MIRGKIEAVTGRTKSKEKQNKVTITHIQYHKLYILTKILVNKCCTLQVPESDAIAELDSVIDSYHGKTS